MLLAAGPGPAARVTAGVMGSAGVSPLLWRLLQRPLGEEGTHPFKKVSTMWCYAEDRRPLCE